MSAVVHLRSFPYTDLSAPPSHIPQIDTVACDWPALLFLRHASKPAPAGVGSIFGIERDLLPVVVHVGWPTARDEAGPA